MVNGRHPFAPAARALLCLGGPFLPQVFPSLMSCFPEAVVRVLPVNPAPAPRQSSWDRVPRCGMTGLAASWEHWDASLIPSLVQWVKDPGMLQLRLRS